MLRGRRAQKDEKKIEKPKNMIIYCIKQHVSVHYNVLVQMNIIYEVFTLSLSFATEKYFQAVTSLPFNKKCSSLLKS